MAAITLGRTVKGAHPQRIARRICNIREVGGPVTGKTVLAPDAGYCLVFKQVTDLTSSLAGSLCLFVDTDEAGNRIVDGDFPGPGGIGQPITFDDALKLPVDSVLKLTNSAGNVKGVIIYWQEKP